MLTQEIEIIINGHFKEPSERDLIKLKFNKLNDYYQNIGEGITERTFAAILKYSNSDMSKLDEGIRITKIDWRDILVYSGFANDIDRHKKWINEIIKSFK